MKKALIVGASGGIGSAILAEMYKDYEIIATSTRAEALDDLVKQFPHIKPVLFDHTSRTEDKMIKAIEGNLDCIVIASGMTSDCLAMRLSDDLWDKTLEVNLSSSFRLLKHAYLKLNREGAVVVISSVVARMGNVGQVAYSASKGGLEAMVRTLSLEFAGKGITVNAVAPGFIATKMTEMFDYEELAKSIPLKRVGKAEEIADAVRFLAGAKYITGHVLEVNGGLWRS